MVIGRIPGNSGIGGVTIHVSRLLQLYSKFNIKYEFLDLKSKFLMFNLMKKILKSKKIYLHASSPYLRFAVSLFCLVFSKKLILMIHGNLGRFNSFKNSFDFLAIRICFKPILINKKSHEKALYLNQKAFLASAYIPPINSSTLDKKIVNYIEASRQNSKLIVVTVASDVRFDKFGNEIYGISELLRYFGDVHDSLLIIADPTANYKKYISKNYPNLLCNGYFINEKINFHELLKISDVFIRNTSTDGDSLSLREAINLKINCYATDVVDRPVGAIIYSSLNDLSLERKSLSTINKNELQKCYINQKKILML